MDVQTAAASTESVWIIDPKYSTVQFSARRLFFFRLEGSLSEITGAIRRDEADISRSSVEVAIQSAGIRTGAKRWDTRLLCSDFLASDEFPNINFESNEVQKGRDRHTLRVAGRLTIRGISRDIVLHIEETDHSLSPRGEEVAYYAGVIELDRFEFGMNRSPVVIGRKIKVRLQIQALRQS